MNDRLLELGRQLLLSRHSESLSPEEREVLEILMRARPPLRRLAQTARQLEALEQVASTAQPPAGFHERLRQRLCAGAPVARPRNPERRPWAALALLSGLLCAAAWWAWMGAASPARTLSDLLAFFPSSTAATGAPSPASVLQRPLLLGWSGENLLLLALASAALLGLLLGPFERKFAWESSKHSSHGKETL